MAGAAAAISLVLAQPAPAATVRVDSTLRTAVGTTPVVVVRGEPGEANDVSVATNDEGAIVRDDGAVVRPGPGCTAVSDHEARCTTSTPGLELHAVVVSGRDGADVIRALGAPAALYGGSGADRLAYAGGLSLLDGGVGDDELTGGPTAANSLRGGPGSDVLVGGSARDSLFGDGGRDELRGGDEPGDAAEGDTLSDGDGLAQEDGEVAPIDADVLDGGGGAADSVTYHWRTAGLDVDLGRTGGQGQPGEEDSIAGVESVTGGGGPDRLAGGARARSLAGGAGADRIVGTPASEGIDAGPGDDAVESGAGEDRLDGGVGDDRLAGGDGDDTLSGDTGRDALDGGPGDDDLTTYEDFFAPATLLAEHPACGEGVDVVAPDALDLIDPECERIAGGQENTPYLSSRLDFSPPNRVLMPLSCAVPRLRSCALRVELRRGTRVVGLGSVAARRGKTARVRIALDAAFAKRLRRSGSAEVGVVARNRLLRRGRVEEDETARWTATLRTGR